MAGFSDLFNNPEALNNLMSNPAMVAGLQLLAQSGPQAGNPSFGQRLGQAGVGTMTQLQQQQHSQQLNAYRQQMAQMQAQQMQMVQAKAQMAQEAQQRQQAAFQNPDVQAQLGPLARTLAAQGLDPDAVLRANANDALQAHRQATLAQQQGQFDQRLSHQGGGGQSSGPRSPAPRPYIDQPVGDGLMQRHKYDPATGDYVPWGQPFNQFSPGRKAKASGADAMTDAILNPEGADAVPDAASLPGTGNLESYKPKPQQPMVMPMTAGGSLPSARPAMRVPGQAKQASFPGAPAVGTVKKGYRYNGGNPADPGSWSKV